MTVINEYGCKCIIEDNYDIEFMLLDVEIYNNIIYILLILELAL